MMRCKMAFSMIFFGASFRLPLEGDKQTKNTYVRSILNGIVSVFYKQLE